MPSRVICPTVICKEIACLWIAGGEWHGKTYQHTRVADSRYRYIACQLCSARVPISKMMYHVGIRFMET